MLQTLPWWLIMLTAAVNISARTIECRSLSDCVTKNWNSRLTSSWLSRGDIWLRASATPHRPANMSGADSDTTRPNISSTGGATYTSADTAATVAVVVIGIMIIIITSHKTQMITTKATFSSNAFCEAGPWVWNYLPTDLKQPDL